MALFATTFLQEGLALVGGALLIAHGQVSAIWIAASLIAGIVCGDCCIYGLGLLARQSAWARRLIGGVDLNKVDDWLARHMLVTVATCHIVPWLLFPTFVAYGWFKVSFKRFALTSLVFSAIYTPLALLVLTHAGTALLPYYRQQPWLPWLFATLLITALIAIRLHWRRSPR